MRCQNGNASEVTLCVGRAAGRIATIVAGGNISNANKVSIYRISSKARNISSLSVAKTYRHKEKYILLASSQQQKWHSVLLRLIILLFGARLSPWCFALRSFTKRAAVEQSAFARLCEHRLASFDYTSFRRKAFALVLRTPLVYKTSRRGAICTRSLVQAQTRFV